MFDTSKLNAHCPNCNRTWQTSFNHQPGTYECQACGCRQITLSPIMVTKEVTIEQEYRPKDDADSNDFKIPRSGSATKKRRKG